MKFSNWKWRRLESLIALEIANLIILFLLFPVVAIGFRFFSIYFVLCVTFALSLIKEQLYSRISFGEV